MTKIITLLLFFLPSWSFASTTPQQLLLSTSEQLIVITTSSTDSISGQMQRFERHSMQDPWNAIGKPVSIVVGKHGMGWDLHFKDESGKTVIKQEGDGLTPMGIYKIGPTFGFGKKSGIKMSYFPLRESSICVDDVKSDYYNQLIDSTAVSKIDWNSGEKMRQVPQYKWGAVIQYNINPAIPKAGSCIFLHIWKNQNSGTAGCVAMEESNLTTTLRWLDSKKNPVIAILTMPIYKNLRSEWKLPRII